ncbi:MAG: DUF2807 domain-containing protein [Thermomicrobiales bacterium]|nr:DUF2807 domain-containing protein [Thermomicrobiales bacterium]
MKKNQADSGNDRSSAMPRRSALRRLGAGGLAAGLLMRGGDNDAAAQSALVTAATEAAARRAVNAINQGLASGDATQLNAMFSPDYVNHTPHPSLQTGQPFTPDLKGLAAAIGELRAFVPNAVILVDDVVASGDTAAIRFTFRGTLNLPAGAQERLRIGGAAFVRISGGQVVESWDYSDAAEQYAGLLAPAAPPTPEQTPQPTPVPGEGEMRDVKNFHQVLLQGVGELRIIQGGTESLRINAEPKVLKRIETEVQDGTLVIRPSRSFTTKDKITYDLMAKSLDGIALSGAGSVVAKSLESDQMQLQVDNAGAIAIDTLTANRLGVAITGNGTVKLGGTVDEQTVTIQGAGKYLAADLQSRAATVTTEGAAQAAVFASESLNASAGDASRIVYSGNPQVEQQTSAAGTIAPAG